MKKETQGSLFILLGALCFSTTGTAQVIAPQGASPAVIGTARMLVGGIALLCWCLARRIPFGAGLCRQWRLRNAGLAALGLICYQLLFFEGVLQVGVGIGTVITIGVSPLAVAVLSFVFFGEKPAKIWYPATALAICGLITLNAAAMGMAEGISPAAMLLPLGAGLSYACYFTFSKPLSKNSAPESVMMTLCLVSGAALLPLARLQPTDWLFTPKGALLALHLGLVTTALAFSLTLAGIKRCPAAMASTLSLVEPLCAACLGIFLLHEQATWQSLTGMLLMLASVGLLIVPTLFKKTGKV